jgi:hypothetical protein
VLNHYSRQYVSFTAMSLTEFTLLLYNFNMLLLLLFYSYDILLLCYFSFISMINFFYQPLKYLLAYATA